MDFLELRYVWARLFYRRFAKKKLLRKYQIPKKLTKGVSVEILEVMDTLAAYKPDVNVLLDIGAHKGMFARAANLQFKFQQAILFEPNLSLKIQIEENNKNFKYKYESIALSDGDGELTFYVHPDDTMSSLVETDKKILKEEFPWDNPDKVRAIPVQTCTLDDYVSRNNLAGSKFFLKLDTQGNELNILRYGLKTLEQTEVCLIEFMFFTPYQSDFHFMDLLKFMDDAGFDCKGALSVSKRPSGKVSGVDFLFLKKGKD